MVVTMMHLRRLRNVGCALLLALVVVPLPGGPALAETQSVIDPTVIPTPPPEPPEAKKPPQSDAELRRARQRAEAEQHKREKAEARALAAEKAAEDMRAAEAARQAEADKAARTAAARAAAAKAAAAKKADLAAAKKSEAARKAAEIEAAARETQARWAAEKDATEKDAAIREEAARELAAREAAAKESAAREAAARDAAAKEAARVAATRPGLVFRDCADCPEMVWLPRGEFTMGETPGAGVAGPTHTVRINYPLAVGRFEVTFAEWDACVAARACRHWPEDQGWGRGRRPVINVSWVDTQEYLSWLSAKTGKHYRLLSEAEWEYAARGGTQTKYWWGNDVGHNKANCFGCGSRWDGRETAPVGSFDANPFGLYDVLGNASEWVQDCYHVSYRDAPADGSAWDQNCPPDMRDKRVMRGGAWQYPADLTRSAFRTAFSNGYFDLRIGFRIARSG